MANLRTGHFARCLIVAVAVGCLAACAEEDGDDGAGGDGGGDGGGGSDPALMATWSGHEVGAPETVWTFVFGETEASAATDGAEVYSGEYTVDTTADPNELTMVIVSASFEAYVGETSNAIYEIVADDMTFAAHEPGDPRRPTGFEPAFGVRIFELTRQ